MTSGRGVNILRRIHVSPERIYQFVWRDKKEGGELYLHLRTRGKKYRKRGDKKAGRGHIPNRTDIGQRPDVVDKKERLGDLEIDLIIGKDQRGALLTINDRATGMLKMAHVEGKGAKGIDVRTKELLEDWIPFIRTMTLSLIHISEPTRRTPISYAVFCLKKKKTKK